MTVEAWEDKNQQTRDRCSSQFRTNGFSLGFLFSDGLWSLLEPSAGRLSQTNRSFLPEQADPDPAWQGVGFEARSLPPLLPPPPHPASQQATPMPAPLIPPSGLFVLNSTVMVQAPFPSPSDFRPASEA